MMSSRGFAARAEPRVHRALAAPAEARGQGLNELVDRVLTRAVRRAGLGAASSPGQETAQPRRPAPRRGPAAPRTMN